MKATFGGKFILADTFSWTLRAGTFPNVQEFTLTPDDAMTFAGNAGPHDLVITPAEGKPLTVKNLWVLKIMPGESAYFSRVMVADRRWMWSLWHLGPFRFNMRRNVGVKRIIDNQNIAVDFDRAPQVAYWKWSLDESKVWTVKRMIEKTLKAVASREQRDYGTSFPINIRSEVGAANDALPIEELTIDDQADLGVNRAMSYVPQATLYVDYDGNVVVYSRATGAEAGIVKGIVPELVGMGHTDLVKNRNVRPKKIIVKFTREIELRVNFIEVAVAAGQTVTDDDPDSRTMENVLPIPDYSLSVRGRTLPQGTYIQVNDAFRSWGNLPLVGATVPLDHKLVQRAFIPHMDLWAALTLAGQRPDEKGTLKNWVGRIAAVQNNYRRTFRLSSTLMDRVMSVRAYRLATIDPQSGQRAPSPAYGDYAIMYTQRSIWRNRAQGAPLDYAINRSAYPGANLDDTVEPSPAVVSVPDSDQGIIHVDYVVDPNRTYEMILPSQIEAGSMPTADLRQRTRSISFDTVIDATNPPRLSSAFKLAVIVTVVPAAPNDETQLHSIEVKPEDVASLIPNKKAAALGECDGPTMEIRIGPQVEVARIQWLDARAADIEKALGIQKGEPDLSGLVVNEAGGAGKFGASLNNIARAAAARVYASLVDRYQGEASGAFNPDLQLAGYADAIAQTVDSDGFPSTSVTFPEDIAPVPIAAFMNASDRAAIFKLVQP